MLELNRKRDLVLNGDAIILNQTATRAAGIKHDVVVSDKAFNAVIEAKMDGEYAIDTVASLLEAVHHALTHGPDGLERGFTVQLKEAVSLKVVTAADTATTIPFYTVMLPSEQWHWKPKG